MASSSSSLGGPPSPWPPLAPLSQSLEIPGFKRVPGKNKEPPRPKCHWDYLLEEMAWLAKDFERERKWKTSQAKRVATRVLKYKPDNEARERRRQKEEEQRLRRIASNIAKDAKRFWTKVEKLVTYKHQLELEGKKKRALDKHLDFLVGQTERYSTMLAETLADPIPAIGLNAQPLPPKQPAFVQDKRDKAKHASDGSFCHGDENNVSMSDTVISKPTVEKEDDTDFSAEKEGEVEDDLTTLEADEALFTVEERKEELSALEREGALPLEELLKLYGAGKGLEEEEEEEEEEDEEEVTDVSESEEDESEGSQKSPLKESMKDSIQVASFCEAEMEGASLGHPVVGIEKARNDIPSLQDLHGTVESNLSSKMTIDKDDSQRAGVKPELKPFEERELEISQCIKIEGTPNGRNGELLHVPAMSDRSADRNISNESIQGLESPLILEVSKISSPISFRCEQGEDLPVSSVEQHGNAKEDTIADAAAAARSAQPTGFTFSTTKVRTKSPFLLKHPLREYQHIGLDWLVTMYEKRLNGILADEMGLGKTIMTISLLAHLACEKGIWGPHLIVVPTSVMLNWETEFMKWSPAFKILTYFGTAKERKVKRQGWSKLNYFHVCITTYRLVIQDAKAFKRKKWKYLILDEAHLIKNWKSQRWQTLLNFNSKRRILLTGTPLQNDLMELWSLLHFLMPHVFQSHQQFRDWFNNPITGMVEGQEQMNKDLVDRLHNVLRPFILRRLKQDVEKQLPKKYEHVIKCRLSKRQRNLYEDFMASSDTQQTLAGGNFLGLINVIMQLRKVCNHPDLFEGRPIISSFDMPGIVVHVSTAVCSASSCKPFVSCNLSQYNLLLSKLEFEMSSWEGDEVQKLATPASALIEEIGEDNQGGLLELGISGTSCGGLLEEIQAAIREQRRQERRETVSKFVWLNSLRCSNFRPLYGLALRKRLTVEHPVYDVHKIKGDASRHLDVCSTLADLILLPLTRSESLMDLLQAFVFAIPAARAAPPIIWCSHSVSTNVFFKQSLSEQLSKEISPLLTPLRTITVRRQLFFPDRRLLQYDCGKLQELAVLLRQLKSDGHRALIFTQMTKMLDVLESFVNLHGYTYLRLDGSTKPEERQILMQRFNTNPKIFLFILSTRSGGVGVNLVGADTVIFYDSDWNPAMDLQAQDRCHRIGQTREVHIYRLISDKTIEENILKKANQKRILDDIVIQRGDYNTEFFKKLDPMELFSGLKGVNVASGGHKYSATCEVLDSSDKDHGVRELSTIEVEAALKSAEDEADYMALKKVELEEAAENQEFTEDVLPGNMEDDECADEMEDANKKSLSDPITGLPPTKAENEDGSICKDIIALSPMDLDEDTEMLADVKQMAEAAGNGSASLDDQLRPIEKYALRFLELWDPIVARFGDDEQNGFEETEWELDQLERLKEEQEAEIDEDDEPLFYESWDLSVADEAYRQQVEVLELQQQQEQQRQLEWKEVSQDMQLGREDMEIGGSSGVSIKIKVKKMKKGKFKSLKKGSLATGDEDASGDEFIVSNDVDWHSIDSHIRELFQSNDFVVDPSSSDPNRLKRNSLSGKLSMIGIPVRKGPLLRLEKEKKKDGPGSRARERLPAADPWMPAEDALLSAIVHEYGGNWCLASEILFGLPDGGSYRGRFRHPDHCRVRYRQLLAQKTSIATVGDANADKAGTSSGFAQLKVTEDHIKQLLEVVQEIPDDEYLLQHHFYGILLTANSFDSYEPRVMAALKSSNGPHGSSFVSTPRVPGSSVIFDNQNEVSMNSSQKGYHVVNLVASALSHVENKNPNGGADSASENSLHKVNIEENDDNGEDNTLVLTFDIPLIEDFPRSLTLSLHDSTPTKSTRFNSTQKNYFRRFWKNLPDQRYRMASRMSDEGEAHTWAASASTGLGVMGLQPTNKQLLSAGKRRLTSNLGKSTDSKQPRLLSSSSKGSKKNEDTEFDLKDSSTMMSTPVKMSLDESHAANLYYCEEFGKEADNFNFGFTFDWNMNASSFAYLAPDWYHVEEHNEPQDVDVSHMSVEEDIRKVQFDDACKSSMPIRQLPKDNPEAPKVGFFDFNCIGLRNDTPGISTELALRGRLSGNGIQKSVLPLRGNNRDWDVVRQNSGEAEQQSGRPVSESVEGSIIIGFEAMKPPSTSPSLAFDSLLPGRKASANDGITFVVVDDKEQSDFLHGRLCPQQRELKGEFGRKDCNAKAYCIGTTNSTFSLQHSEMSQEVSEAEEDSMHPPPEHFRIPLVPRLGLSINSGDHMQSSADSDQEPSSPRPPP